MFFRIVFFGLWHSSLHLVTWFLCSHFLWIVFVYFCNSESLCFSRKPNMLNAIILGVSSEKHLQNAASLLSIFLRYSKTVFYIPVPSGGCSSRLHAVSCAIRVSNEELVDPLKGFFVSSICWRSWENPCPTSATYPPADGFDSHSICGLFCTNKSGKKDSRVFISDDGTSILPK